MRVAGAGVVKAGHLFISGRYIVVKRVWICHYARRITSYDVCCSATEEKSIIVTTEPHVVRSGSSVIEVSPETDRVEVGEYDERGQEATH